MHFHAHLRRNPDAFNRLLPTILDDIRLLAILLSFSDRKRATFSIVMEPGKGLLAGADCVGET